jgi:rare lipoprotein A
MDTSHQPPKSVRELIRRSADMLRCIVLGACVMMTACSEVELGSHVWKSTPDTSQGNFKVGKPYNVQGQQYTPKEEYDFSETGIASWYGPGFQGKKTANGEKFDTNELTAAHRTLQMPSLVRVTNLENGRSIIVRVNDRGPFSRGRVMDVSSRAAELLGFKGRGTARVRLDVLADQSRQIAAAAKAGQDVRGMEVALNRQEQERLAMMGQPAALPTPVEPILASSTSTSGKPLPPLASASPPSAYRTPEMEHPPPGVRGHFTNGIFYPDQDVTKFPVTPTSIYVQVGAFGERGNAERAEARLKSVGNAFAMPVVSRGRQLYRVRLGPITSVDEADILLNRVVDTGFKDAILIVDQR